MKINITLLSFIIYFVTFSADIQNYTVLVDNYISGRKKEERFLLPFNYLFRFLSIIVSQEKNKSFNKNSIFCQYEWHLTKPNSRFIIYVLMRQKYK